MSNHTQQLLQYVESIPQLDIPAVFPYSRMWLDDGKEPFPEEVLKRFVVSQIPRIATNPLAFERKGIVSPILGVFVRPGEILEWLLMNFSERPVQLLIGNQADIDMIFVDNSKTIKIPLEVLRNQYSLPAETPSVSLLYLFVSLMNMNLLYDSQSSETIQKSLESLPEQWRPIVLSSEQASLWFPKVVWITNYIKTKHYRDRTACREAIKDFFKVYESAGVIPSIDECVILTDSENADLSKFIDETQPNASRFRVISTGSSKEPISLEGIFQLLEEEYPTDIVYITRMGIRPNRFTKPQSGINADSQTMYYFTPFLLPDIPDPRPEPYQQGKPYFMAGFLLNRPKEFLSKIPAEFRGDGVLNQISLYTLNLTGLLGGLMTACRMKIQNGTLRIGAEIVHLDSFYTTMIRELTNPITNKPITQMHYNSGKVLSFQKLPGGKASASSGVSVPECTLQPMKTAPLEVLTLFNMANKYLQRDGKNMQLVKEPRMISAETLDIRSYNNVIIRSGMIYNPITGRGITIQGDLLGENQYRFYKGFVHPKEDDLVFTLPEKVNWRTLSLPALVVYKYHFPEKTCYLEVPKEDSGECMKLLSMFKLQHVILYNTEDVVIHAYKHPIQILHYSQLTKDYEYSPGLLAECSRISSEVLTQTRKEIIINVPEGELTGTIIAVALMNTELEKSVIKAIQEIPEKTFKILVLTPEKRDWWAYILHKADYIIGHATHPAWVYTLLSKPKTGVIEIDSEHKYVPKWYFWNTLQEKPHYVIPLKEEPLFRHCMRVEKYLKDYIELINDIE
jgi:hypothetical protein